MIEKVDKTTMNVHITHSTYIILGTHIRAKIECNAYVYYTIFPLHHHHHHLPLPLHIVLCTVYHLHFEILPFLLKRQDVKRCKKKQAIARHSDSLYYCKAYNLYSRTYAYYVLYKIYISLYHIL